MIVRLLGTAAGGGFPQWNCRCAVCEAARRDPANAVPRSQSSVAVSADGERWFLLNASPDLRQQMTSFPPLWAPPGSTRGSRIEGILLTNADLDHCLGLLLLREGERLRVHGCPAIRESLNQGLNLERALGEFCGLDWTDAPDDLRPLTCRDGSESGLLYRCFPVPGKAPRYVPGPLSSGPPFNLGYKLVDRSKGSVLVFMPDAADLDARAAHEIEGCDLLLLDGTFWSDDEMVREGAGSLMASQMAHLPLGGPQGSLAKSAGLSAGRKVFMHINNTNPILLEGSPQRAEVLSAGFLVGCDGMEWIL